MANGMRAVFSVVDYSKSNRIGEIYKEKNIPLWLSTHGFGMADSSVLELLGFGENRKSILVSLLSKERADEVFSVVEQKMQLSKPGYGIMFSVPLTGATAFLAGLADQDNQKNSIPAEERELKMTQQHEYELIISIVAKGFLPEIKAAAIAAGARGGTLIHALGLGAEEAQKFLGIAIQPEKDVILNVVRKEKKHEVMKAIGDAAGINTEGRGIIFSLPVDSVLGLRRIANEDVTE